MTIQVKLHFTGNALRLIARKAMAKNTGARGLRAILENILTEAMFEVYIDWSEYTVKVWFTFIFIAFPRVSIIDASQSWVNHFLSLWKRVNRPSLFDIEGEVIDSASLFYFFWKLWLAVLVCSIFSESCDWQRISICNELWEWIFDKTG